MKKMLFTAGAALVVALGALSSSHAQLTENWAINIGDQAWFANDSNTRGLGYNPVTDNVYVVSRTPPGLSIQTLAAATGVVGTPLSILVTPGDVAIPNVATFPLNDVKVTDEGVIYGVNLALATQELRVYRWASESAQPTLVYTEAGVTTRYGDSLALRGVDSDNSTEIFIGGNGSGNLKRLITTDNGATLVLAPTNGSISTGQATSWGGIMPRRDNSNIVIATLGLPVREIQIDGTIIDTHDNAIIGASFGYGGLYYSDSVSVGTVFLGAQAGNVATAVGRVFNITAGVGVGEPITAFNTPDMGTNANGNGAGAVQFTNDGAMIVLSTNNRIGSYGSVADFGVNKYAVTSVSDWSLF